MKTTTMPRDMQPVSVETLTRAMQEIDLLPKPDQWIVIDPQGRMYKGTVEQMTRLLVRAYPLMRTPFELSGRQEGITGRNSTGFTCFWRSSAGMNCWASDGLERNSDVHLC